MLGSSPGPPATPSAKECGGHALRGGRAPSGVSQGVPWASVPLLDPVHGPEGRGRGAARRSLGDYSP